MEMEGIPSDSGSLISDADILKCIPQQVSAKDINPEDMNDLETVTQERDDLRMKLQDAVDARQAAEDFIQNVALRERDDAIQMQNSLRMQLSKASGRERELLLQQDDLVSTTLRIRFIFIIYCHR